MRKQFKSILSLLLVVCIALSLPLAAPNKAQAAYDEEHYAELINEIIVMMPTTFNNVERAVFVHEYFTANFEYDLNYSIYSGYEFLLYGTGVCQAYAEAYRDVMNTMGIECYIATSDSANHAWNVVKLGNEYYHVDCTWDDPLGNELGKSKHHYLLVSTETLHATDLVETEYTRTDWEIYGMNNPVCDDKTYENCGWSESDSAIVYCNGGWYRLNDSTKYVSYTDNITKIGADLFQINKRWYVSGSTSSYWVGCFSGMFSIGNSIYGNTPSGLWCYDTVNGEYYELQLFEDAADDIYGCTTPGNGFIYFEVKEDPNSYEPIYYSLYTPLLTTDDFSLSTILVNTRKAVLYNYLTSTYEALLDVNSDGIVNVKDLVRTKTYIAQSTAAETEIL